jgi:hypothetical protein
MFYLNAVSEAIWSFSLKFTHQTLYAPLLCPMCATWPVMQVTGNTKCRYIICHNPPNIAQGCNWRFIHHNKERIPSVHFRARSCILIPWKNIFAYLQKEDLKLKARSEIREF